MAKKFILGLLIVVMMLLCSFSASAFIWVGYIKNSTGQFVGGANVSVKSYNPANFDTPQTIYSNLTNSSGYFQVTVAETPGYLYQPYIIQYSGGLALEMGPSLPIFDVSMFQYAGLNRTTIHTQEAVSLNVTMFQFIKTNITNFSGDITDADKGYFIQNFRDVNGTMLYLPANRNYTISIYNMNGPPRAYTINNISSYSSPKRIDFLENISSSFFSLTGYAIVTENSTPTVNFTGFYYYDFVGNHVFLDSNPHPMFEGDNIDSRTGFYNLSLPNGIPFLLAVYANDSQRHYEGFLNVTMTQDIELNATLHTLAGTYKRNSDVINTSTVTILVTDASTGASTTGGGFIQVATTYTTTYNSLTINWEGDMGAGANSFNLSLLNSSTAKITIFNSNFAPRKYRAGTAALNAANATISVGMFTMNVSDDTGAGIDLNMVFYKSNSTCDVPLPPVGCLVINFSSDADFNPMEAMLGGSISMRFVQDNDVVIHYVNVDMLKSGPPDIMMTPSGSNSTSGSALESAWKFGSKGPDVYDYLLIGVPYDPVTMNENSDINISIPVLYDEDWNVIWNTSTMGTGVNLTDYADYTNQWFTSGGIKCTAAANLSNSQNCSLDTSTNMIWLRLPHFSAVGPSLKGTSVTSTTTTTTTTSSSGGGGGSGGSLVAPETKQADLVGGPVFTGTLEEGDVVKFSIAGGTGEIYSIEVVSVGSDSVDVKLGTGLKDTIKVGESKDFDVDGDGSKDITASLSSINRDKAYMKISRITKEAKTGQTPAANEENKTAETGMQPKAAEKETPELKAPSAEENASISKIAGIAVFVVAALLLGLMLWHRHKRKEE